jgi:DNA-binding protein YbaB
MSKIIQIDHALASIDTEIVKQFNKNVENSIKKMQDNNLEVEVQYQQSDKICSVLILGREEEK